MEAPSPVSPVEVSDLVDPSSSGSILQKVKTATEDSKQDILSVREVSRVNLS
jgi:hypothetical protein